MCYIIFQKWANIDTKVALWCRVCLAIGAIWDAYHTTQVHIKRLLQRYWRFIRIYEYNKSLWQTAFDIIGCILGLLSELRSDTIYFIMASAGRASLHYRRSTAKSWDPHSAIWLRCKHPFFEATIFYRICQFFKNLSPLSINGFRRYQLLPYQVLPHLSLFQELIAFKSWWSEKNCASRSW